MDNENDQQDLELVQVVDPDNNQDSGPIHDQLPSIEEYKTIVGYKKPSKLCRRKQSDPSGLNACIPDRLPNLATTDTGAAGDDNENDNEALMADVMHNQLAVDEIKGAGTPEGDSFWRCFCMLICFVLITILIVIIALAGDKTEDASWIRHSSREFEASRTYLIEKGISRSVDLFNKTSPQYIAAQWLSHKDGMRMEVPDIYSSYHLSYVERYTLAVFYFALGGEDWTNQLNFLTDTHVCTWYQDFRIDTNSDNLDGEFMSLGIHACQRIEGELVPKSIYLPNNNLKGTIPQEIEHLDHMEAVYLQFNSDITGSIPGGLKKMERLRSLALQWCGLTGSIPSWIGSMGNLKYLGLGNNLLTGSVPAEIVDMTNLELLGLDDNQLEGDIDMFRTLSNLKSLYLEDNRFTGSLSENLVASWPNLQELDVSGNKLTGSIPEQLFKHEFLEVLDLHDNDFKGPLPIEFSDLSVLEFLALQENKLTGKVPSGISNLKSLRHLDLNTNSFASIIPESLDQLTNLEYLFLGDNNWQTGSIPNFLIELTNLRELSMKRSKLNGELPNYLHFLTNLEFLDFHYNELTGSIPSVFGLLSNLKHLLLRYNKLTGTLPSGMSEMTKLDVLLLEHNELAGTADPICKSDLKLVYFAADCNSYAGIDCSCCNVCCDGDNNSTCGDGDWDGSLDPIWEHGYQRDRYAYDMGPHVVVVP